MAEGKEIPAKTFAGVMLILVPVLFWLFLYLRHECAFGHCSIPMEWLIFGMILIVFGLVLLISTIYRRSDENAGNKD